MNGLYQRVLHFGRNRMIAIVRQPIDACAGQEMSTEIKGHAKEFEDIAFTVADMHASARTPSKAIGCRIFSNRGNSLSARWALVDRSKLAKVRGLEENPQPDDAVADALKQDQFLLEVSGAFSWLGKEDNERELIGSGLRRRMKAFCGIALYLGWPASPFATRKPEAALVPAPGHVAAPII